MNNISTISIAEPSVEHYEAFIDACKKDVWKYVDLWKTFSNRIGYNINMENDYYGK